MGDPSARLDGPIAHRPLTRLADALSGKVLASRPQNLMAQVLRKEIAYATPSIDARADHISFVPSARPPMTLDEIRLRSSSGRTAESRLHLSASRWLSISPDDFVLTPPFRLRLRRQNPGDSTTDEEMVLPGAFPQQQTQQLESLQRPAPQRMLASTRLRPTSTRVVTFMPGPVVERSAQPVAHRRQATRPQPRRAKGGKSTLAQLQVAFPPLPPILLDREPLPLIAGRRHKQPLPSVTFSPPIGPAIQRATPQPESVAASAQVNDRRHPFSSPFRLSISSAASLNADPDFVGRRMVGATSRQVSSHIQPAAGRSPINRAFHHLAGALSGRMLASRPQVLMAQILAPEPTQPRAQQPSLVGLRNRQAMRLQAQQAAPLQTLLSTLDRARFTTPIGAFQSSGGVASSPRLPISVDDFVLPTIRRHPSTGNSEPHLQSSLNEWGAAISDAGWVVPRPVSSTLESAPVTRAVDRRRSTVAPRSRSQGIANVHSKIWAKSTSRVEPTNRATSLVQLQAAPLNRAAWIQSRSSLSPLDPLSPARGASFEPISAVWRQAQFSRPEVASPLLWEAPSLPLSSGERQQSVRRAAAQVIPLELAMRRLLGSPAAPAAEDRPEQAPPQTVGRVLPPAQGRPQAMPSQRVQRRQPSRTLMERVLDRDFAGARAQAASTAPTGLEASLRGDIVYLPRQTAPSDRPQASAGIVHSLPFATMQEWQKRPRQRMPLILSPRVIHSPLTRSLVQSASAPAFQPLPPVELTTSAGMKSPISPATSLLRPHLTRQLSQRLAQMSLPREDLTAAAAQEAVAGIASSARIAHRFAPASNTWQPHPSASSLSRVPGQDKPILSTVPKPGSPGQESSAAHRSWRPQRAPIARGMATFAQPNRAQPEDFSADTVRALLEPGSLSIETLSDSSLLQRPAHEQRISPLTDFVLARVDAGQQMRASQPSLTAPPVEPLPAPVSPLRPAPPYPTMERPARRPERARSEPAPSIVDPTIPALLPISAPTPRKLVPRQGRVVVPRSDEMIADLDLRRAVQSMANRPQHYERLEPVSQIWRSDMLSTSVAVEQPSLSSPAPSSLGQAPSLQRLALIQPSARLLSVSQPLPLAPTMRAENLSTMRRAGIQVADVAQVAEAARQLPVHRRAEQTIHMEIERSRQMHATRLPSGEQPRHDRPNISSGPRIARLVRRNEAPSSSRPTLLERVAARDFADLRREHLAEGPLLLPTGHIESSSSLIPSSLADPTSSIIPASASLRTPFRRSLLSRQLSKELVQRSGLSHYPNLGSSPLRLQPWGSDFDPVSKAWPRQPWIQPADNRAVDRLPTSHASQKGSLSAPHASARIVPLELAMRRLLGPRGIPDDAAPATESLPQVVGRTTSPAVMAPMVARMERQGWRFKRADRVPKTQPGEVRRSVESLGRERSRPLARPVRTLMERVLGRDFAGVRVQTASMAPLGLEAAMRGDTVYLSRETARLDRPQSLGVLAHELTHVAAHRRQAGPAVQRQAVQRQALPLIFAPPPSYPSSNRSVIQVLGGPSIGDNRSDPPMNIVRSTLSPLHPHLTRQLSQRLVQMSLAQEERTAEEVEDAVVRLASSAHGTRQFAPASHLWRMPLFEESLSLPAAEEMDLAGVASPLATGPGGSSPLRTGQGRVSKLSSLDVQNPQQPRRLVQPERTVAALEREGWRFKRAERPRLVAPDRIQRAVAQLQQRADRGMLLPRQPRSLMERVLQRDFSKVRVQTAPLQALGVEAAARDNTVYLAREQASRLDQTENLALLGHELTHVAASGNAPVQRSIGTTGDLPVVQRRTGGGVHVQRTTDIQSAPMPLRPLLPTTIQRTLAGEEGVAARVEAGLRTFLRHSSQNEGVERSLSGSPDNGAAMPVIQRKTLAARAATRTGDQERIQRLAAVDEGDSALPRLGVSPVQLKGFRGGEPTLSGVPSDAMQVAPRTPILRRMPDTMGSTSNKTDDRAVPTLLTSQSTTSAPMVQRYGEDTSSLPSSTTSSTALSTTSVSEKPAKEQQTDLMDKEEPDWDQLAEKVYPLIRRMLQLERERRPR